MRVKCIGGPNNGEWHDIRNNTCINDHVQIYTRPKLTSVLEMPMNIDECVQATATKINHYILKCLRSSGNREFKYLIPEGKDEFDCLVEQLKGQVINDYDKINKLFELRFNISFDEWLKTHEGVMKNA